MSTAKTNEYESDLELAPDESPLLDALESYSRFVDELFDQPRSHAAVWEGNVNKIAVRSMARVLAKWRHVGNEDQPPMSLIVRLSRKLCDIVADIGQHPRRILQRKRSMEPVNRFRELDSSCVRWLTRQPGISIAEKAGHRRQILAVQRFESTNTLENRVLVDLLHRCRILAADYLRQHQRRFPKHPWITTTLRFRRLCDQFVSSPELANVRPLVTLPQPNYVLLHETRYHEVWLAYVKVIRQQQRRQQLWQNRQTVWAEMCIVAIWNSINRHLKRASIESRLTHRSDLWFRDSIVDGGFFDWRSCPPDWASASRTGLAVLHPKFRATRFGLENNDSDLLLAKVNNDSTLEALADVRISLPDCASNSNSATANVKVVGFDQNESVEAPLDLTSNPDFFRNLRVFGEVGK